MVAFDRKNVGAAGSCGRLQDDLIGYIATTDDQINPLRAAVETDVLIISKN